MAELNILIARSLIADHNITTEQLWKPWKHNGTTYMTWQPDEAVWNIVKNTVRNLRPNTAAVMIWVAKVPSLYDVHGGTWLDKYDDGRALLRDIAATTLMATIKQLVPKPATRLLV